ncbi:MAG: ABC transporter substrate-binding protein [Oscillospiraceae bacterium]|jgi:NitT/TauT family transport system substrate-binding protein|nr:ABC transporter substrate-binding protein [Oscillospiraceae bacterium]
MKKTFTIYALLIVMLVSFAACAGAENQAPVASPSPEAAEASALPKILALRGPTGIGMAYLANEQNRPFTPKRYEIDFVGSPDEAVAAIASGQADIVCVPTNLAAALYSKLNGGVRLLAINTLGVLHILESGETVADVSDLAGKTVWMSGQGSMPEYVLRYIIETNELDTQIDFKAEHAEVAALAAAGELDLVMLPEPFATSLAANNDSFRYALDVTQMFGDAAEINGSDAVLSMGCVIASAEFAKNNPYEVDAFLSALEESIAFVYSSPADLADMAVELGIMPNAAVVMKALSGSHIKYIDGAEMQDMIQPLFEILYKFNPQSVGGKLPEDDLYYIK